LPVFRGTAEERLREALAEDPTQGRAWAAIAVGPEPMIQGLQALATREKALRDVLLNM
jgi:Tfp pilus assembly protein PilF